MVIFRLKDPEEEEEVSVSWPRAEETPVRAGSE